MKKTSVFNNISDELYKSTILKKDEVVRYKVYLPGGGKPTKMAPSVAAIPNSKNVPASDTIYDPHKDEYVSIAAIKSLSSKGEPKLHKILFRSQHAGLITVRGGRVADQEIHTYMCLTDFNGSKKERDTSKKILFTRIDEEAAAEERTTKRNKLRDALNAVADLSPDEVKMYSLARGANDARPVKVLRDELEVYAEKHPEDFLSLLKNQTVQSKSIVNKAVQAGVVKLNREQSRFEWPDGEEILVVARTTGADAVAEFANWLTANPKGDKVFTTIKSKLRKN